MLRAVSIAICWSTSVFAIATSSRPLQIVQDRDQKTYEHYIRQTNNKELISLIPRMVFYSESVIGRMFQIDEYTSSFNGAAPTPSGYLEPNTFFPWKHPGGLTDSSNATTFKFIIFPEPKGAKRDISEKIQYWRQTVRTYGFNQPIDGVLVWLYPVGTIFGEVLLVRNSKNEHYTFEVRIRTKEEPGLDKGWTADSFRPFPAAEDLFNRVKQLAEKEEYQNDKQVAAFLAYLGKERKLERRTVSDDFGGTAFKKRTVGYEYLPPLPEKMVKELLTTTEFIHSCGSYWVHLDKNESPGMPTTREAFHVVPHSSNLPMMHVDNEACMSCHDGPLNHATKFAGTINGELWYGYVRGSDRIFSFSVIDRGYHNSETIRQDLIKADVVASVSAPK